jgi:hypothetical protein
MKTETHNRRIVAAPSPTHPSLRCTVLDVECAEDEDVDWLWTETAAGSFISGYRLIRRESRERVTQFGGMT